MFRVEGKDDYLDVGEQKGAIQVFERIGISLEKIQKGAVVFSNDLKVFAVDTLSPKTKYWVERFLKATPSQTPQRCAQVAGALLKTISSKVEPPNTALEFARQVEELIAETDSFSMAELRQLSKKFAQEGEINELIDGARLKYGVYLDNDVQIDTKRLAKYARDVVTKARIAEGVSLLVSNPDAKISSIEVKSTKFGFRAVVDFRLKGG